LRMAMGTGIWAVAVITTVGEEATITVGDNQYRSYRLQGSP
jgi:ubiquinone/menaquinone biosynthesis C-methylase UbiE